MFGLPYEFNTNARNTSFLLKLRSQCKHKCLQLGVNSAHWERYVLRSPSDRFFAQQEPTCAQLRRLGHQNILLSTKIVFPSSECSVFNSIDADYFLIDFMTCSINCPINVLLIGFVALYRYCKIFKDLIFSASKYLLSPYLEIFWL